jgi:hypothetical protein
MQGTSQGYYLGCYTRPQAPFLTFKVLADAERDWQEAEKASANDPEKLLRVQTGHLAVRYAFLLYWADLRKQCAEQHGTWPLAESPKVVADQFAETCKKVPGSDADHGVVLNEGGLSVDAFVKEVTQNAH